MGLFLQTVIIPNSKEDDIKLAMKKVEENTNMDLISKDCQYKEIGNGVNILINEECAGYEELAKELSKEVKQPTLLLYIYDEDYWGYHFYENGKELDSFNPIPDYFEDISNEERKRLAGNSKIIAKYFNVNENEIKNYLITWTDDIIDEEELAYEDDEFSQGDCWQMADFMRKIGYPYEWE